MGMQHTVGILVVIALNLGAVERRTFAGECNSNADCDDNNACTDDFCFTGEANICIYTPIDCDDGDACTLDSCSPVLGCFHLPNPLQCSDGNPCTTDLCLSPNGDCIFQQLECPPGESCDPDTGECQGVCPGAGDCCVSNGSPGCDDADCCACICACDPFCCDTQWDGLCAGDGPCGASNPAGPCAADCAPCIPEPECLTNADCDDNDACTDDFCFTGEANVCVYTPIDCDDGDACTLDSCSPVVGCFHLPDPLQCSDGDPCTNDVCISPNGDCVFQQVECPAGESCNPDSGECQGVCPGAGDCCVSNGSPGCDDADCCACICACDPFCCGTQWDALCAGGGSCGASNPEGLCADACAPCWIECVQDVDCSDLNACTHNVCAGGLCDEIPVDCDDGDPCTEDACLAAVGCVNSPIVCAEGEGCDSATGACVPSCPEDIDGDGGVSATDVALLLGSWGACPGCPADLNDDGTVDGLDLALLLGAWGPCS